MKRSLLFALLVLLFGATQAQSPKKFFKAAEKFMEENNYSEAINSLNQAIAGNVQYVDAYVLRAQAFEKTEKYEEATADYVKLVSLEPKVSDHVFNAGRLYYRIQDYDKAMQYLTDLVRMDAKHFQGLQFKAFTHIKRGEYQQALVAIEDAIKIQNTFLCSYTRGVAFDSLQNRAMAIQSYQTAIGINPDYQKAFVALTKAYLADNNLAMAIENANRTIGKFPNFDEAYEVRSLVYYAQKDYMNAINDLSKLLTLSVNNLNALFARGMYYFESKQYNNAKADFSQIIAQDNANMKVFYWRARSSEELMETANAIKDFSHFVTSASKEEVALSTDASKRLYELQREADAPVVMLDTPMVVEKNLAVIGNVNHLVIKGKIIDKSPIKSFLINGKSVAISKFGEFAYSLLLSEVKSVEISAVDNYDNNVQLSYGLMKMEADKPIVRVTTPYASDNNEIYLEANNPELYIEGVAQDESLIKDITVDGIRASFKDTEKNPVFSAKVNIADKQSVEIKAVDAFGNTVVSVFTLNREGALIAAENPMGKTWVIFIENSAYETFASLEGPVKDVATMKAALSGYQIHNFIHKKNMTKSDMEKFFSIELRDQVKKNNVNSLLVWYAGHGKFINETGYWIPVDATRDDEFTYFNINSLKAGMQSYSNYITHTLVVTDACESGPSFYQAMRATNEVPSCDDVQATKFRSSQVFSSAGYELAADNSQFTKTFAKSLQFNGNSCIPIESIVNQVQKAVSDNEDQKPKFGKIAGLEDENGTFFFMKK